MEKGDLIRDILVAFGRPIVGALVILLLAFAALACAQDRGIENVPLETIIRPSPVKYLRVILDEKCLLACDEKCDACSEAADGDEAALAACEAARDPCYGGCK